MEHLVLLSGALTCKVSLSAMVDRASSAGTKKDPLFSHKSRTFPTKLCIVAILIFKLPSIAVCAVLN
jgi:hypothetical protein